MCVVDLKRIQMEDEEKKIFVVTNYALSKKGVFRAEKLSEEIKDTFKIDVDSVFVQKRLDDMARRGLLIRKCSREFVVSESRCFAY